MGMVGSPLYLSHLVFSRNRGGPVSRRLLLLIPVVAFMAIGLTGSQAASRTAKARSGTPALVPSHTLFRSSRTRFLLSSEHADLIARSSSLTRLRRRQPSMPTRTRVSRPRSRMGLFRNPIHRRPQVLVPST